MDPTSDVSITRSDGETTTDKVAVEEPLEIRIGDRPLSITMRTPGDDYDLAAGFLFTEGVLRARDDIQSIRHWGSPNVVRVTLCEGVRIDWQRLQRHFYATSSCGICGKTSIDALRVFTTPVDSAVRVSGLAEMAERLRREQKSFEVTGAIHGAGAFRANGELVSVREDIGRHNAVDKVIGAMLFAEKSADVLVISGRASFEVVQKCVVARIPVVAAVGAPSSLAVDLAAEYGVTLAGFLRGGRFNAYAHPERLSI